jgi:anaerobic selenocysteine-containing dehydrogenase
MPVKIVKAACPHDCPDTCAMQVQVEDGRAIKVMGDPLHPTTRGTLCTKVARYTERTYHAERLLTPLRAAPVAKARANSSLSAGPKR